MKTEHVKKTEKSLHENGTCKENRKIFILKIERVKEMRSLYMKIERVKKIKCVKKIKNLHMNYKLETN